MGGGVEVFEFGRTTPCTDGGRPCALTAARAKQAQRAQRKIVLSVLCTFSVISTVKSYAVQWVLCPLGSLSAQKHMGL